MLIASPDRVSRLIAPAMAPYDDMAAYNRMVELYELYALAERDDGLARDLVGLASASTWFYTCLFGWTFDQTAQANPSLGGAALTIKPFPPHQYFQLLFDWLDERTPAGLYARPKVLIDKTRDVSMSWAMVLRMARVCHFQRLADAYIVSKTEADSFEMTDRIAESHRMLPKFYLKTLNLGRTSFAGGNVWYPNGSSIEGMAQKDGEAFRSRVPTIGLLDEMAFQTAAEKNWTAAVAKGNPDEFGGGRNQIIGVSTANPGFFGNMIAGERLEVKRFFEDMSPTALVREPGLQFWKNEKGIDCARLYFYSDPGKRSVIWFDAKCKGLTMDRVKRELLIDYNARGGQPIFPMLDRKVHVMRSAPMIVPLFPKGFGIKIAGMSTPDGQQEILPVTLFRAVDHGMRRFACVWVAVDDQHDWFVYRTYVGRNLPWQANVQNVHELSEGEIYGNEWADALRGLDDGSGQVIDLFRGWSPAGSKIKPFAALQKPWKGNGSRTQGLDAIQGLLLATMAINAPGHGFWEREGYSEKHRETFAAQSQLLISPNCEEFFEELSQAVFDERRDADPTMELPETSLDMQDDLIDAFRYVIRGAGHRFLKGWREPEVAKGKRAA